MSEEPKIFFSYSRVDGEEFALKLATDLRKAGCNIWIDQLDIRPGKPWDLEIEKALKTATSILFIATEKSTTSNNVLDEVYYALDNNKEVIPVVFGNCQIPFRLRRVQHIDFTHSYESAFNRLLPAIKPEVKPEGIQPENEYPVTAKRAVQPLVDATPPAVEKRKQQSRLPLIIGIGLMLGLIITYVVLSGKQPGTSAEKLVAKTDTAVKKTDSSKTITAVPDNSNPVQNNDSKPDNSNQSSSGISKTNEPNLKIIPRDIQLNETRLNAKNKYFRLQLKSSEKYLDASYCGTSVVLNNRSDYSDGACQLWRFVPVSGGWNRLQLKNGDQYLCADNCTNAVILKPASTFDPNDGCALWRFVSAGNGWSRLQLRSGEQYLDAVHCEEKVALGNQSDYSDGACQLWRFVPALP